VSYQDGLHFMSREVEIEVKEEHPRLDLEAKIEGFRSEKDGIPEFRPGEEVTVAIRASDERGEPARAEIALAVVDEAIFAIRPDRTPDPMDVFYRDRGNWVRTAFSFPMRHFGGAGKEGRSLEVRRDFRDTALWQPTIRTGADGKGSVAFRLPDNLTTWRLTFRGADSGTRFHAGRESLVVTKDLLVSLEGPRFFHRGDRVEIPAMVHNRKDEAVTGVELELKAAGDVRVAVPARKADIGPLSSHRETWKVGIPEGGTEAVLVISASGPTDGDAMEVSKAVVPRGRRFRVSAQAILTAGRNQAEMDVDIPANAPIKDLRLAVDIHSSLITTTFASLGYLRDFPFGCLEQTLNGFLPRCVLARTVAGGSEGGGRRGIGRAAEEGSQLFDPVRVERAARQGIAKILERQTERGGWSWWRGDIEDPMVTAFALEGLLLLDRAGFNVPKDRLDRGLKCLDDIVTESQNPNMQAYGLHVLSLGGRSKDGIARGLMERMAEGDVSADGLAYTALYHQRAGHAATAEMCLDRMLGLVAGSEAALLWRPEAGAERPAWFGGWEEMTARCLTALATCRPDDVRGVRIVHGLVGARRGSRWSSTRATSLVILALAEYLRGSPESPSPEGTVLVSCNGEPVAETTLPLPSGSGGGFGAVIPSRLLRRGLNRISVERLGTFPLYVSVDGEGWLVGDIAASGSGEVEIRRELFLAERLVDSRGRPQILEKAIPEGEPIPAGKEVGCRITVAAKRSVPYAMLQVWLPSGFEVSEADYGASWWTPYEYSEQRDRSIDFAFQELAAGETVITPLLRAELAGSFYAPPATVWAMYDPGIEAWTASGALAVAGDGKE